MSEIKAGVVLVSRFIVPGDAKFSNYINYINRDEAVRNENFNKFSAYQDYMNNPEKTTAL
ncbi:MAG: relaxase MobL, partial [Oscillospiraceae bacterium]